ncbi:MAG: acetylglutamate kinase [Bacteroidetes bacterium]|nr:acetylglutamate kinase [Bacteroidota bacterium]
MKAPIVVKIGGAVLDDLALFWEQVKAIDSPVVIVHGGGAQSTELANKLGHTPKIIEGRRVTGDLDLKIAEWAMRGRINVRLTAEANTHGIRAVGLSGVDGAMIKVRRREPWNIHGEKVDFGWVGEIISIDTALIEAVSDAGFISIIAPLGIDHIGQRYNVNADTIACTLARSIRAKELLLVTDTGGVLRDLKNSSSLLKTCSPSDERIGIDQGWISGGMSVKLKTARKALEDGVPSVYILGVDDLLQKKNATSIVGVGI